MGKLQPNFSWQKYEGKPEDQKEQFQYQLQSQHIQVSNSVNATIDDESFFTRERQTSFTWVNSQPIYTQTFATVAWTSAGTINTIPMNITGGATSNFQIIGMDGTLSNGTLASSTTVPLPYLDVSSSSFDIQLLRTGQNLILTTGGTDYSNYSGFVTVYYIKS